MRIEESILMAAGSVGVLIFIFGTLLPAKRAFAARGHKLRMVPVCFLSDYLDRVIARKREKLNHIITAARTHRPTPIAVQSPQLPVAPRVKSTPARPAPLPIGRVKHMPCYFGRVSMSNLGPAGELFVFLEKPLTDSTGNQHVEIATNIMVPPEARPFIEECIQDMRMVLVNGIPDNEHEIRLRMTIQTPDGRLVPMREWILEQALTWRPIQSPARRSPGALQPISLAHRASFN